MGRDDGSWTTIESDPGVFTELIEKIGVQGVQVEELWSLDKDLLLQLSPVLGLVFLFKYEKEPKPRDATYVSDTEVFFAQQVIPNACATQAILNILLNVPSAHDKVALGAELAAFREFTRELPPDMKGLAISNSEVIRTVHNSMARPESLLPDEDIKENKEGEAFHFIAYLPVDGSLYELDGLQPAPIRLASGLKTEARIEQYQGTEVRFNLMALVADRRTTLQQQLDQLRAQAAAQELSADQELSQHIAQEIHRTKEQLDIEQAKRKQWQEENVRRRTNYIPLMFNLLRALAESGELQPFIQAAKEPRPRKAADSGMAS